MDTKNYQRFVWQLLSASFAAGISGIARPDDFMDCRGSRHPDKVILNCTRAIESKTLSPKELVYANAVIASAYFTKGYYDKKSDDYRRSIDYYSEAIKILEPNDKIGLANLYWHRGTSFRVLNDYDSAIKDYTIAIESRTLDKGDLGKAYCERGLAYEIKGDIDAAKQDFEKSYPLVPAGVSCR